MSGVFCCIGKEKAGSRDLELGSIAQQPVKCCKAFRTYIPLESLRKLLRSVLVARALGCVLDTNPLERNTRHPLICSAVYFEN